MKGGGVAHASAAGLFALSVWAADARAATFEGSLSLELDYLGESFTSHQIFTEADLGPSPGSPTTTDTTRFHDATWLPGPRLTLRWRGGEAAGTEVEVLSRTEGNAERVEQTLELGLTAGALGESRWLARARGALREEERSLIGHGDWQAGLDLTREQRLAASLRALLKASAEHSRTRGDTTGYLYDYNLLRGRAVIEGGDEWLHSWEAFLEGTAKEIPHGLPGSYREARAGAAWIPDGGLRRHLDADVRWRDVRGDSVGRDQAEVQASGHTRVLGHEGSGLDAFVRGTWTQVVGSDELYFDAVEASIELPWTSGDGAWSITTGPGFVGFWDLEGGSRDYRELTGKIGAAHHFAGSGFAEIDVTGGFRNYRAAGSEVVEVSSISAALVRSDYWLIDLMVLAGAPVGRRLTLDLLASFSWEFHEEDAERVHVGFLNVGITRRF